MTAMENDITAYRGFDFPDADYTIGETRKTDGPIVAHTYGYGAQPQGFRAYDNPLNVWTNYPGAGITLPAAKVTLNGATSRLLEGYGPIYAAEMTVNAEIDVLELINLGVMWVSSRAPVNGGEDKDAAVTGDNRHAAAAGLGGRAAAVGDGGNAVATGKEGHAAATGDSGHAAATGKEGNAVTTGVTGNAFALGEDGSAVAVGDGGSSAALGSHGRAAALGGSGRAFATGDNGHAFAAGFEGQAFALGEMGIAVATGFRGHATSTKGAVAASLGIAARAKAETGGWIILAAWGHEEENRSRKLLCVRAGKIGGPEGLVAGTTYCLSADGEFVEDK